MEDTKQLTYKIFEKVGENQYRNLFHSRKNVLECGCTCLAVKKMVYEGYLRNGDKKLYMSGIHVISELDLCYKYLKRFKNQENKVIVQCLAYNTVPKPDGRKGVLLADEICLIKEIK